MEGINIKTCHQVQMVQSFNWWDLLDVVNWLDGEGCENDDNYNSNVKPSDRGNV